MRRSRAQFYYRLSILTVSLAFLMFLILIGSLFYLVIETLPPNPNDVCQVTSSGICLLRDEYRIFNFIIIFSVGLIAVFLILTSQFQQYFIPESLAKIEKRRAEKNEKKESQLKKLMASKKIEVYESDSAGANLLQKPKKAKIKSEDKKPLDLESQPDTMRETEQKDTLPQDEQSKPNIESIEDIDPTDATLQAKEPLSDEPKIEEAAPELEPKETVQDSPKSIEDSKVVIQESTPQVESKTKTLLKTTENRRTQAHTKEDISQVIENLTGLSLKESRDFIDAFTEVLSEELIKHNKIAIHQFGTFNTSELKARQMQVPTKGGESSEIEAHHVVRFKPSPSLMDYLNKDEVPPPIEAPENGSPRKKKKPKTSTNSDYTLEVIREKIAKETRLNQSKSKRFLNTLMDVIQEELTQRNTVIITQFGTFKAVKKAEKTMIVPTKKDPVVVAEHYAVEFTPNKRFIDEINPKNES